MASGRLLPSPIFISSAISCPGAITRGPPATPDTPTDTSLVILSGISAVAVPSSAKGNDLSKYSFSPNGRKPPTRSSIPMPGL